MTNMKRTTVSLPDEMVLELDELRKEEEYRYLTYSEVIRRVIEKGLEQTRERAN